MSNVLQERLFDIDMIPEALRVRFADYGSDASYFKEIARRREVSTEKRERLEHDVARFFAEEVTLVLDTHLPVSFDSKDLFREEDDLDARVMQGEALDLVEERIHDAEAAGFLPPPHFVREKWYAEEMERLSDVYRRSLLEGEGQV